MARAHTVDGVRVPAFIYGTAWKEGRTRALTAQALGVGFRGIDTANQRRHYCEAEVGAGVASAQVPRDELFLQTKFTYARGQDHRLPYDPAADVATQVAESMDSSLDHLGTRAVDSYLLHGPWGAHGIAREDRQAWGAMEELRRSGKARLLGISNVSCPQLVELWDGGARPAFVQNRCYARTGWDREVRTFCRQHGILYQGFSLLTANVREIQSPALHGIAARVRRTPAQIVFAFALQVGMIPLTGTSSTAHMREDLASGEVPLSPEDVEAIERIGQTG